MSNYPPGVTGNEPQIAGYPRERDFNDHREVHCENEECKEFDNYFEAPVNVEEWGDSSVTFEKWEWTCPACGDSHEFEREFETETSDPDSLHDSMYED